MPRYAACELANLPSGKVHVVSLASKNRFPREALVVRDENGEPRAFLNQCKHLPIPLDAGSKEFFSDDGAHLLCLTHGAEYRLTDGLCVAGPCDGESLDTFPITIENGVIYIIDDP